MCHYCPNAALTALKSFSQADIHLLDSTSILKELILAEHIIVILAFFALPVYDAKIKSLKAYMHIFMNVNSVLE